MIRPVNFADPTTIGPWLETVAVHVEDLTAAAEDQLRPHRDRRLGPATARQHVAEAAGALRNMLAYAIGSLPDPDATPTEPGAELDAYEPPWQPSGTGEP
jgi:hypothetical protein